MQKNKYSHCQVEKGLFRGLFQNLQMLDYIKVIQVSVEHPSDY